MASSCSGHHENTMITLRIKRKNGADVAPEFYSQDETRPIAKRLTSKTGELLSKTSLSTDGHFRPRLRKETCPVRTNVRCDAKDVAKSVFAFLKFARIQCK